VGVVMFMGTGVDMFNERCRRIRSWRPVVVHSAGWCEVVVRQGVMMSCRDRVE